MMNTAHFIERLLRISTLPTELVDLLKSGIRHETYKPHQILYAPGQFDTKIYFVAGGLARNYYIDGDGKEHTTRFWAEAQIIFSHEGFRRTLTNEYLEVLEDSYLLSLSYLEINKLSSQFKETNAIIDHIDQQYRSDEMFHNRLLTMIPEERYKVYRKRNPQMFRRVPLRIIASYLNLTREGLSRIMARGQ